MKFSTVVFHEIPVRPRVKKFIQGHLRDQQGRPQAMHASSISEGAGLMLWAMAQSEKVALQMGWRNKTSQREGQSDGAGRINAPADMTERLGLAIGEFHKSRHQYLLNYAELEVFSTFVEYIILNELVAFCALEQGTPPMIRIKAFCDKYDFSPEDYSEESLRQAYWRHRNETSSFQFDRRISQLTHFQPLRIERLAA